jgi:acetylornithine deacetylase/succinyl-diaminopimelate desuccinylase-like protein
MDAILEKVSVDRLGEDLWSLVNIPSPTGREREAAFVYAEMLAEAGAEVEIDERIPESPNVIGRLQGTRAGKVFQLAGHIDHIDVPHEPPQRTETEIIARGAADMKGGLAGILEVVRVLEETGRDFPGELLITVYGLHEAPVGDGLGLRYMAEDGTVGDAAVVVESVQGLHDKAIVQGKGQSVWNLTIRREGEVCHELNRTPAMDGLLETVAAALKRLRNYADELTALGARGTLLGPPSLFIGQVHYGDFYNRAPAEARMQGTRRWHPDDSFEGVKERFAAVIGEIPKAPGIDIDIDWNFVGEAYEVAAEEPVVRHLQAAYEKVTGQPMEIAGIKAVADGARLVPWGKVPTVLCAFDNRCAHADREVVVVENLVEPCRVTLLTLLNYLEESAE